MAPREGRLSIGYRAASVAISLAYAGSNAFSTSALGYSLMSPRMCGAAFRSLKRGQFGSPRPFGSPLLAKLTQYDDIISAIARSFSDAIASFGELTSGITRGDRKSVV